MIPIPFVKYILCFNRIISQPFQKKSRKRDNEKSIKKISSFLPYVLYFNRIISQPFAPSKGNQESETTKKVSSTKIKKISSFVYSLFQSNHFTIYSLSIIPLPKENEGDAIKVSSNQKSSNYQLLVTIGHRLSNKLANDQSQPFSPRA